MRIFSPHDFALRLPHGHRFPGNKYQLLRQALLDDHILKPGQIFSSPLADPADLVRAHDRGYIEAIESGLIDAAAMRRIGFPWSDAIAPRAKATVGGAIAAAREALDNGISGQLAGGTHHAHYDFGAGYCVFNDQAAAALAVIAKDNVKRVAIIDLDVHQGDGTAAILANRDDVFVFSMHGDKNFPFRKTASNLDVALPDGTADEAYLEALERALLEVWSFGPDLVLYQAGVDPLAEDKLGRLAITHDGLIKRDEIILQGCRSRDVPVSLALGGGYASPIDASVEAYANTYRVAKRTFDS